VSTLNELANELATALYSGVIAPIGRLKRQVGDVFAALPVNAEITVSPGGSLDVEFTVATHGRDGETLVEKLLELPQAVARQRQRRVVLILDEFQQVVDIDEHLPALMRSIFQIQTEVTHIYLRASI
jgi:hypothetical protein